MARGGMRWGAGRPGYKVKAETLKRIDVRRWQREGYLRPGNWFSWGWQRDGESTGSIGVRVSGPHAVALEYRIGADDDVRDASQHVPVERTRCGYGGWRCWFACPVCGGRAALLYLRGGRFACRACQRVAYASQSEDLIGRMWRKQAKIESRLADGLRRPKGMRRRTHERLLASWNACDMAREEVFGEMVLRVFEGLGG